MKNNLEQPYKTKICQYNVHLNIELLFNIEFSVDSNDEL